MDSTSRLNETVERVCGLLVENYVHPSSAKKCVARLQQQLAAGAYEDSGSDEAEVALRERARALTADLQKVTRDKHLRIRVRRDAASSPSDEVGRSEATRATRSETARAEAAAQNYGFRAVRMFEHNIGYIYFNAFPPVSWSAETAAATMQFVANTDALIFDLSDNMGGSPDMVAFLCSYLFQERTHLNSIYWRTTGETEQFWTHPVPGPKYIGKPVYVLTSSRTFSGAEEFAYNLQQRRRARIVGEVTAGGAHPGSWHALAPEAPELEMFVPSGKSINPVSGDNWEGRGVRPDVYEKEKLSLDVALMLIEEDLGLQPPGALELEDELEQLEWEQ